MQSDSVPLRSRIYVANSDRTKKNKVREWGAKKVWIQLLIDRHRAATFIMRRFFIKPRGETPLHAHRWEHEVFILKGRGIVTDGRIKLGLRAGTVVYVPPNQRHQFRNTTNIQLVFLCLIPK